MESWEGGSLLAFSLEKSPGEEEITEISIEFQYLGVLPRGQAALPGEASFLEWTEEKAALQYAVPEEGYLFAARQEGDYNTGHFYSLEESSWNHQRWNLFGGLLLGSAYFLLADLAARFGRRRRRLENRKYWKLDELSGEYILAARTRTDPPLLRRNRSVFKRVLCFQFLQRLLLLAVVGQWLARLLDRSLDRSFITFSLALILLSVLLYYGLYCWFYLIAYKKILSLGEQNPSGAAVCFLDLRFISAPVPQWVLSDLNFAVFMMRSGYYRESALFAGELWRRFGKNQKQGRQYLQYQYVQFCSFHYMGKEEQDFFEIGGQTFYNASDALGKNYIARADGSCFLNLEDFLLKNGLMEAPLPQDGLELFQTIGEQYLIVGGSYNDSTILDDTSTYRELRYLCDVNGNLLYRNWNRSGIGYARDQYGNLDKRYLEFSDDGGKPSQFLDLETGEEITVPEGWSDLQYKKDGLFLLENQQDYCIYDASDHSQGLSFRTKLFRDRIFLFGKRSYAIQSRSGAQYNQLVLERREVDLGTDTEFLAIIPGENPVILEGGQDGACTVSYILDAEGKLLYQGDGNVRGADGPYYLEQDGTEYRISMNGE